MCGIIFAHHKEGQNVNDAVVNQLQDQISRGQRGFGIVFADQNMHIKKITRATELTKTLLDLYLNQAPSIVLHHRTPTSSKNKIKQTHPFAVEHGSLKHKYLVVVNGIVNNEDEMKKKHENELGFVYTTDNKAENEFNDCEALAWELARHIEGQTEKIETKGYFAFVALQVDKEKIINVYFGTTSQTSAPLKLAANNREIFISSEGKGEEIKDSVLYSFDTDSFKIKKKELKVATNYIVSYTGYERDWENREYSHYHPSAKATTAKTSDVPGEDDEEIEGCRELAGASLDTFFASLEATDSPVVVSSNIHDALTEISTNMLDAYSFLIGINADKVLDETMQSVESRINNIQGKIIDREFEDKLSAK
jgi:glucosamine 6-phosphate synthetase-like amidotransferase/phosphosugar isomerase protein